MTPPGEFSALPPPDSCEASPKAISGRTSYLRVRLEFLPYPHLIATLFNGCAFGPPRDFTPASAWTWVGHPVSGLRVRTLRPLQARFPFGSVPLVLNLARTRSSPDRSTKSTRSHLTCSRRLSTQGFRFSFTPLPGSFSPFPHGTVLYRSLGSVQPWGVVPPTSRRVPRVPRYSGSCRAPWDFAYGVLTLSDRPSQAVPLSLRVTYAVRNPGAHALRFGLLRFRSPLLTESMFLSLPPPT